MSKSLSYGVSDTPITGVSELTFPRVVVNFGADYRIKEDEPDHAILTNLTAPQGKPESFRWAYTEVADVYKGTDIEPALRTQTKRGVQVLIKNDETWVVTDSADPTYEVALPVSAHLVLKIPNSDMITSEQVMHLVGRLISGMFDSGVVTDERLTALLRGSLKPSK